MKQILLYFRSLSKRKLILIAFILCLIPRVILTVINTSANDDHISPIMIWMETDIYPEIKDCWECFQPPFYYGIIKTIARQSGAVSKNEVHAIFKGLNFVFAFCSLVLVFLFQFKSNLNFKWNLSLALFWGLNPKLIAISIQATNDIPIIALGMLFTVLILKWIENKSSKLFILILLTVLLAGIIKGNGLVLFIVLSAVLFFALMIKSNQKLGILINSVLLLILLPVIMYFGNYYHKYQKYDNPFVTNMDPSNAPNWFVEDTIYNGRKGVTTIWDSFFTFRLINLLEEPYIVNETDAEYPINRTSFFTQLYGQFSNAMFEQWPWDWLCKDNDMLNFSRANYLVQLPLLLIFIFGIIGSFNQFFKEWKMSDAVHLAAFFIYLLFAIKYSYDIRDYGNMKIIFIFPALLSMMYFLCKGITQLKSAVLNNTALILVNASTLLYAINLAYFHIRLFSNL